MKILLIHNSYQQAGGEDIVFEQECCNLINAGHDVITYRRDNSELVNMPLLKRFAMLKEFISSDQARHDVREMLIKQRPDIVHVHNTFTMITPSIYDACHEEQVPVIQTLHNYRLVCPAATLFRTGTICGECAQMGLWRSVRHGCYRQSRPTTAAVAIMLTAHRVQETWGTLVNTYVAPSEFVRRKLGEVAIPQNKIVVKPNFVTPDPGARSSAGSYALFAGRLVEEKGVLTLLRAWQLLKIDLPLLIVGDGPLRPHMEAEISRKGVRSIRFAGWLDRTQVQGAMKGAKFVIFPSEWYEPFGLTIVEAFACGAPVIGSRLAAAEEIITDGRTGLHFVPAQAEDLALKIDWASEHPTEMVEMGIAARREYEAKYTARVNYVQSMDIYKRALGVSSATH